MVSWGDFLTEKKIFGFEVVKIVAGSQLREISRTKPVSREIPVRELKILDPIQFMKFDYTSPVGFAPGKSFPGNKSREMCGGKWYRESGNLPANPGFLGHFVIPDFLGT